MKQTVYIILVHTQTHTVIVDGDGLILHFGHLHVVVRVVYSLICLHIEHLCGSRRKSGQKKQVKLIQW